MSVSSWALAALLAFIVLFVLFPAVVFALQVLSGRRSARAESAAPAGTLVGPTVVVLMPAHNEASGIALAIVPLLAELESGGRVLVIADNCSDETAAIAASLGAEVTVRNDPDFRGKGHALAHGVDQLRAAPPDVVMIVDADCCVEPGAIRQLGRLAIELQRPIQAAYLMNAPEAADLKLRVAQFAWRVKNLVRPRGMHRLGLPCPLTGSGMAFPWSILSSAQLASSHLVEDMQLGLALASQGTAPVFCETARVTSDFAPAAEGQASQRTRWEHGHLSTMKAIPALMLRSAARRDLQLFGMALDLCVPPLALLVLLTVVAVLLSGVFAGLSGRIAPLWIAIFALGLLCVAVCSAWFSAGRDLIGAREILSLPRYVLAKIPLYLRFVFNRQVEWVRSGRDGR